MNKNVLISDIAKIVGTNISTVSRALNNSPNISEARRIEIQNLAKKLGYRKNINASDLARGVSSNVILYSGGDIFDDNFFYGPIVSHLFNELISVGKIPLIINNGNIEEFLPHGVEKFNYSALIFIGRTSDKIIDEIKSILKNTSIPIVFVDDWRIPTEERSVVSDCTDAIRELVKMAAEKGHKNALLVGVDVLSHSHINRSKAFLEATAEAKIKLTQYNIPGTGPGFHEMSTFLDPGAPGAELIKNKKISVIFCFNDYLSQGIRLSASRNNMNIPGDLSITGIDGISINRYIYPGLTTIAVSPQEFAKHAITLVTQLLSGNAVSCKIVKGKLFVGDTLGVCKS